MKKKGKPSNATAEIALDNSLDEIKFSLAKKYYNDVIGVTARYDVLVCARTMVPLGPWHEGRSITKASLKKL